MKKVIALTILVALALVLGRSTTGLAVKADGGGGQAAENGDCNGDGSRDISDAVYLLSFLFQGGSPPVALAVGSSDLEKRVAALEAIISGCLSFPDRNQDGIPDCGQVILDGTPCVDDSPCTAAAFFVGGVCRGVPGPDGVPCDDGNPETINDRCVAGVCQGTPRVLCGDGFCDPTAESIGNCPEDCGECQPGMSRPCDTGIPGECANGMQICAGGRWGPCQPQNPPMAEACDGRDNNCNGAVDEGFDLMSDRQNCGQCGRVCPAGMVCINGQCVSP